MKKTRKKKNKTTKNRRLPSFWRYHIDRDIRKYEDKKSTQTIYRKTNEERESAEKKITIKKYTFLMFKFFLCSNTKTHKHHFHTTTHSAPPPPPHTPKKKNKKKTIQKKNQI